MAHDKALFRGEAGYPPGVRASDIDAAASPLDDLSSAQLWDLLSDDQRETIYREFFRRQWDELACCLEDHEASSNARHNSPSLGESFRSLWRSYRDAAADRLAVNGQIATET